MTAGINLHQIVRGAITALHPDVAATLYQSTSQTTVSGGQVKASYAPGLPVIVQAQSENPSELFHADRVGQENISRKFWLNSVSPASGLVTGIVRPLGRNGDLFQIDPAAPWFAGLWWLVDALIEDFSRSGWVSVRATLQVKAPDITTEGTDNG